ncbi:hypothetical protein RhiirA4_482378 [Rhizophagus irregularis]|uniref:Uncharacterized protein n=1 Tax=Rhizophagus irregularis TaxID=588596 RepID=A0A2I1HKZ1_9GLOM|nr:hypothetical protein RhiirA4_482378 [Rhizophagus irregularis]
MEEDMEEKVQKAIDHLVRKHEWTQDFIDYGKYKYMEKDVSDMLELYKYTERDLQVMVTQKVEEEREEQDKKISDKFKYTEEDMEEIVAKAVKDQIKEKDLFKENVVKTAREIAGMMGLKLDNIDFGVSGVNKDRQTEVLFQEIQKANAKQMVDTNSSGKSSVNQACSSHLPPEIKKEIILVDEKIGQKRVNKEELSRGTISSEGTEDDSESETSEINLEGKNKFKLKLKCG